MRRELLTTRLKELFENASGIEIDEAQADSNFIEIGFDSLLLTQIATNLKKEFDAPITFRKLFEEYNTIHQLAAYLDSVLPSGAFQPQAAPAPVAQPVYSAPAPAPIAQSNTSLDLIQQQIQALAGQLAMLQNGNGTPAPTAGTPTPAPSQNGTPKIQYDLTPEEQVEVKKPFGATARIEKQVQGLSEKQQSFLRDLTARYNSKT